MVLLFTCLTLSSIFSYKKLNLKLYFKTKPNGQLSRFIHPSSLPFPIIRTYFDTKKFVNHDLINVYAKGVNFIGFFCAGWRFGHASRSGSKIINEIINKKIYTNCS